MILLSILVFVLVTIYFVRDLTVILKDYPIEKQIHGNKYAIRNFWLDFIFCGLEGITLLWIFLLWVF